MSQHKPSNHIILVLGFTNDKKGNLHPIARERAKVAFRVFREYPDAKILLTGGWGNHFNLTDMPHAAYTRSYLESLGVPPSAFLEFARSGNTIEDARLSKVILSGKDISRITLITSDFHVERVKFIFPEIYDSLFEIVQIHPVSSGNQDQQELQEIKRHETLALQTLKKHGVENYYRVKLG